MSRLVERVLDVIDTAKFWAVLAIMVAFAVMAYAYGHNRAQASRNAALISEQSEQLSYLCETVAVLDVTTLQQLRVARETLRDPRLPAWAVTYLSKRENVLQTQHQELSNSRGCRKIE